MKSDREILSKYDLTNTNKDVLFEIILCAMNEFSDQFKEKPKKSIEDRKSDFRKLLYSTFDYGTKYNSLAEDFFDYWTEHGENAKKMRFEKEKVFDIKKRLERWNRNQKTFNNGNQQQSTTDALNKFITE